MWWSKPSSPASPVPRRAFLGLGCAAVLASATGCGFTPVYAPGQTGDKLNGRVRMATPSTNNDYTVIQQLEDRFGPAQDPAYILRVSASVTSTSSAITRKTETTRITLNGQAFYTLTQIGQAEPLTRGTVRGFASYSTAGTTVSNLASRRNATSRLMIQLADDIADRLLATTLSGPSEAAAPSPSSADET